MNSVKRPTSVELSNRPVLMFLLLIRTEGTLVISMLRCFLVILVQPVHSYALNLRCGVECAEADRSVLVWRAADRRIDAALAPLRDDE